MIRHRRAHAHELLDAPVHDMRELEQSLDQLAEVNRLLGGTRAVLKSLRTLLPRARAAHILDVGTGSADVPLAIAKWASRSAHSVHVHATDLHPQMRALARARTAREPGISVGGADARALPFRNNAFDIVLLSLTLHHFEQEDQVEVLREAGRVAARAVVVNELERNRMNYFGARLLAATRWRGNRLTRHDGPLSVLRAFTRAELRDLASRAGLRVETLQRRYFYRLVLIADTRTAPLAPL